MVTPAVFVLAVIQTIAAASVNWNGAKLKDSSYESLPSKLQSRIVGGYTAFEDQFPYQVGLLLDVQTGLKWCGGSLIAKRWVLTAAHCLEDAVAGTVFLGAIQIVSFEKTGQIVRVDKPGFHIHEGYDARTVANDIAMIELPQDAKLSDSVQIVNLPSKVEVKQSYVGITATASGWGRSYDESDALSEALNYVELKVIPEEQCRWYYGALIQGSNICTSGSDYKSTCLGDSGGPLVYVRDGRRVIIGLTSFGSYAGCQLGYPAVFTRVSSYLQWIGNFIDQNSTINGKTR